MSWPVHALQTVAQKTETPTRKHDFTGILENQKTDPKKYIFVFRSSIEQEIQNIIPKYTGYIPIWGLL